MENASKALLIAGGMLISIIVISVGMLTYNNATSLSRQKQQVIETEQLAKYNAEWEAFNRNDLKGTDIISAYNKAIYTNKKYKDQGFEDDMITVFFKLNKDVSDYYIVYQWNADLGKYVSISPTNDRTIVGAGKAYDTKQNASEIDEFIINGIESNGNMYRIKDINSPDINRLNIQLYGARKIGQFEPYVDYYSPKATFKLLDFRCANTKDESKSGLVYDEYRKNNRVTFCGNLSKEIEVDKMENASKALLIAASTLIGILILSVIAVLYITFGDVGNRFRERMSSQEIQEFNSQFIRYEKTELEAQDGKGLKAQEVLALAKLVEKWNKSEASEKITMKVGTDDYTTIINNYISFLENDNKNIKVIDISTTDSSGNPITVKQNSYPTYSMKIVDYYDTGRVKTINLTKPN